jgi:zinc transport system substrate-binding protein
MGSKGLFARALLAAAILLPGAGTAAAQAPRVVASIAPVHALVAGVMQGVGTPDLIVRGYGSPHGYQMRPSDARSLDRADVVFWIGAPLETFLQRPLRSLAGRARVVGLLAVEGMTLYAARAGGAWDPVEPAERPGASDPHIWLDPGNARRIVAAVVRTLGEVDPAHRATYRANGAALSRRLEALDDELRRRLAPVRAVPYVVFHDSYQYLEKRYGLNAVGSITVGPDRAPGARRLRTLRARLAELGARCVFREPQFRSALVDTIVEGTAAGGAMLDPLGAGFPPGAEAYFQMMTANAAAIVDCLSGSG